MPQQDSSGTAGDSGYIYLLINPSMEGLVKIGKTQRDSSQRAKELSAATGVPTPFVVVYEAFFEDCSRAEEHVHARLESQGYRVSESREFFSAPVKVALQAIQDAEKHLPLGKSEDTTPSASPSESSEALPVKNGDRVWTSSGPDGFFMVKLGPNEASPNDPPWKDVYKQAEAHRWGLGDALEDKEEAIRLFKLAAKMGSSGAFRELGQMTAAGEGCTEDARAAIEWFKESARLGRGECLAEMALIFSAMGHKENAQKCWSQYFKSTAFGSDACLPPGSYRGVYGWRFCIALKREGPPFVVPEQWGNLKEEILEVGEQWMNEDKRNSESNNNWEGHFLFVLGLLFPEQRSQPLIGKVKWFSDEKGFGFITHSSMGDCFLHNSEIIEGTRTPGEEQEVEFDLVKGKLGLRACNVRVLGTFFVPKEFPRGTTLKGRINWFDPEKGFGFIEHPEAGHVFLHHTDIVEGSRTPTEGQQVIFGLLPGPKGPKAINAKVLDVSAMEVPRELPRQATLNGKIKWFNPEKGFGFIDHPEAGDVFLYHTEIVEGSRTPAEGQQVEFIICAGPKGPMAVNVKIL
jgi:cold shock CspA family protein